MHLSFSGRRVIVIPYMYRDSVWPGGAAYIDNLINVLSSLPEDEQPLALVLDLLDDPRSDALMTAARAPAVAGVFNRAFQPIAAKPWFAAHLVDPNSRTVRPDVVGALAGAVDGMFPIPYPMWGRPGLIRPIYWIPDFQHKHLPELFTDEERSGRDRIFGAIAASDVPLVLSSQAALADYNTFFPDNKSRNYVWSFCSTIPLGAVGDGTDPRSRFDLPEHYFYIANQFWTHKDHRTAFQAVRLLRDRGRKVTLVCTGLADDNRNPDYMADLDRSLDTLGIRDQVRNLGMLPRAQQFELFRHAAAVIQPSRFEGWSTVVEDTRVFGRPIILSDIPVHQEQMGGDGLYFRTGDAEDLARTLLDHWDRFQPGPNAATEAKAATDNIARKQRCARALLDILAQEAALRTPQPTMPTVPPAHAPTESPAIPTPSHFARPAYPPMGQAAPGSCYPPPAGAKEWYPPVMFGVDQVTHRLFSGDYVGQATALLDRLDHDDYTRYLQGFYHEGRHRFGPTWRYADIVTVLLALSDLIQPRRYLEIGVRRGRSLCAVASRTPTCDVTAFDMWIQNYAGIDNPGPTFVQTQLARVGHTGTVQFINGNSHETVPRFFAETPGTAFDLITVDGDHSPEGAAQDLRDVLPHLSIGGAVVFDDIAHPAHPDLRAVWNDLVASDPRYAAWSYDDVGYGVGMGIRKY